MFTSLGTDGQVPTNHLVASLIDMRLLVRTLAGNGEDNRVLTVHRSRGMAHSNQVTDFLMVGPGVELADVYVGPLGGSQGKLGART
jgi:circadian clock protein KaiC